MRANIVKWGNSQGVRLPKLLLESAHLSDDDTVDISVEDDRIVIRKASPTPEHKTIQERFAGFDGDYKPEDIDWGPPVGRELW